MAPPVPAPVPAPVPPAPTRDTRREKLLAWALEKEAAGRRRARSPSPGGGGSGSASGSSGSWPADDDKQRLLQRRREIMAAPSLETMKRRHQEGDECVRRWQAEMEGDALSATSQADREAALDAERGSFNQHDDDSELKARVDSEEMSPSPRSSPDASFSEGDNQRSEPEMSDDEDSRSLEQEEDAFEEALTHLEDIEADDLSGSYFALDAADVLPADRQPLLSSDDEQQQECQDEQRVIVHRAETVDVSVHARRNVETVVEQTNPEELTQNLVHPFTDDEDSISQSDAPAATRCSPLDGAPTSSTQLKHNCAASGSSFAWHKSRTQRWRRFFTILIFALFAGGGVAMIWYDPTSPLVDTTKEVAALATVILGSTTVAMAHWVEDHCQQSSLAPFVDKLALALASVVEKSSHWPTTLSLQLKALIADGWSVLKSQAGVASGQLRGMYHTMAGKLAGTSAAIEDYLVDWWTEHINSGKLPTGDSAAEFVDPLAGERIRMAAIKEQLDHQEAWVLTELERMKTRRAAYSSATNSLLSESKSLISDSIHEAKDATMRRIKTFSEQIAMALKGSTSLDAGDTSLDDAHHKPDLVDDTTERIHRTEDGDSIAERAASLLSHEAEVAESKAETAVDGQELETTASDTASLGTTAGQEGEAIKVSADEAAQRQNSAEDIEAPGALECDVSAKVENVQGEEHTTGAAKSPELIRELDEMHSSLSQAASVRDELQRIAKEEALELDLTTVKVAAELLKTGAEIEEDTLLLRDHLDAARAVAENEAMVSVCTDAHCLTESDAIERFCEDAQCIAESESAERVCNDVRCAAKAVETMLHDMGARIGSEKQDGVEVEGLIEPSAHIPDVVEPEAADITSPLLALRAPNATASLHIPSLSLTHLLPMAIMSSAFLSLAVVSGYYFRRAWKLRQQRIARHERWRRRFQRKQWQSSADDEEDDEAEEVVLMSGPSTDTIAEGSDAEDNSSSSTSAYEAFTPGVKNEEADSLVSEEETESGEETSSSATSGHGWMSIAESNVETSDVTEASASEGVKPSSVVRVTRHAAQYVLSYSPVAPDSASPSARTVDSDESM